MKGRESNPLVVLATAAYGLLLTVIGVLAPYLEMFYEISLDQYGALLFLSVLLLALSVAVTLIGRGEDPGRIHGA